MSWVYEIYNPSGSVIGEIRNARNRKFGLKLNNISQASFTLDIHDDYAITDILHVGRNELRIRNGATYYWGGVITNFKDYGDQDGGKIVVTAFSYEWWLTKRLLESGDSSVVTGFSSTDVGEIITDLIDETQAKTNGDFGFTEGNIETSVNRTRQDYKIFDDVWHLIKLLTRYVDFEITAEKVWNVYYPEKGSTRNIELVYPNGNIEEFTIDRDVKDMANEVYTKGQGIDDAMFSGNASDATQQGTYYLLQDSFFYDSDNETVLDQEATEILTDRKAPIDTILRLKLFNRTGSPTLGQFLLGDTIRLVLDHGSLFNINSLYRIEEIDVAIDDNDSAVFSLGITPNA